MSRSCTYASGNTAENDSIRIHGISEGEKQVLWYIRNGEAWNTIIETDHSCVEEYSRKNDKVIKACIEQRLKEDELSEQ